MNISKIIITFLCFLQIAAQNVYAASAKFDKNLPFVKYENGYINSDLLLAKINKNSTVEKVNKFLNENDININHKYTLVSGLVSINTNIKINKVNWLGERKFTDRKADGWDIEVKIRSTRPPVSARVFPSSETQANIVLSCNEQGVAPGQACVFYQPDSSRVLGGGWITN